MTMIDQDGVKALLSDIAFKRGSCVRLSTEAALEYVAKNDPAHRAESQMYHRHAALWAEAEAMVRKYLGRPA